MQQRHTDLDTAKGLAILLVVFGHIVARQDPQNVHWYEPLRRAVYAFHMPFFLYLSGFTAASSGFLARGRGDFLRAMRGRARRLLLPFFGLGLIVLTGKLIAAQMVYVDNVPADFRAGLVGLFWHTAASPALSVWYLFVLFTLSMAAMWVLDGSPGRLAGLLTISLLTYCFPVPAYLYADRVFTYAPFFLLGAMGGFSGPGWNEFMRRHWTAALAFLLAGLVCVAAWGQGEEQKLVMLPLGTLSMPALHGALRQMRPARLLGGLLFLGENSFTIYLGNTICIGLTKGIMLRFISWDGVNFLLFAPLLMAAGVLAPIAARMSGATFLRGISGSRWRGADHLEKYPL